MADPANNDDTIFNNQEQTPATGEPAPASQEQPASQSKEDFTEILKSIQEGDRQKYSNIEDALNSIQPAQEHINTIESENARMKEELTKRATAEETLAKFEAASNATEKPSADALDTETVATIVQQQLTFNETVKAEKANTDSVVSAMKEKYGDKAEEIYTKAAQDNGIGVDFMNGLAAKSPMAVMKLVGLEGQASSSQPNKSSSSVNTESFQQPPEEKSLKFREGASMQEMTDVWKAAGDKIKSKYGGQ
jgi:hypothetical protein